MIFIAELSDILGKTVNVYKITESLNDFGDVTKATSSTISAVAEIQKMSGDEREVRAGILKTGDAIGFFAPSENITIGDEVEYQSDKFNIVGLFKEQIGTTEVFQEVQLSKIIN